MSIERSAGAVVYHRRQNKIEYLLLQYRHQRWDFPRGHIEAGESALVAAKREIKEETGLANLIFTPSFKVKAPWYYQRPDENTARYKEAIYFLAASPIKKVMLDPESLDYKWVSYNQALALPAFPHVHKVLTRAHNFLKK